MAGCCGMDEVVVLVEVEQVGYMEVEVYSD
ncbi:hypothetical protein Taro_055127 [Colocasia esculenta]|uniref:Uncharacterized protein n=1 Tax=Colocasia esculenta TaxID=4460 RepID=A0A843XQN1_COLES|nr:hypothetical protein [Colocasia esculenta]